MTIENVNTILKNYLFSELSQPSDAELDFSFDLPNKKWMSSIASSENWVNIYLLEIHENLDLRQSEWTKSYENGTLVSKKPPHYVDLYYLFTFYNKDKKSNKEHAYLEAVLLALFDFSNLAKAPVVDESLLQKMQIELFPKPYIDEQLGFQLWSALDQDARPFIPLKITIPLESNVTQTSTPVETKKISYFKDEILYDLKGKVFVKEGTNSFPSVEAALKLIDARGEEIYQTVTDNLGNFEFKNLRNEELIAIVKAEGYVQKEIVLDDLLTITTKPIEIIVEIKEPQP